MHSAYYVKLDVLHLVVNVFKHGKDSSLTSLKKRYPGYFENLPVDLHFLSVDSLDYKNLKISDAQINEFSEAILSFWQDIPERISDDSSFANLLPDWFEKARQKDFLEVEKK